MTNEKVHYKMYKDGRTWVFAAITVATLGLGIMTGTGVTAHAATDPTSSTATGATDTTSEPTAVIDSSSADTTNVDGSTAGTGAAATTEATDPAPATTTAPTPAPAAAPVAAAAETTNKYVGNAQSQPAIVDKTTGEPTKSTDGSVSTNSGSNGVTVGSYWTAENGDGDVTQTVSENSDDKSNSTLSASAQNIQSHFTFGNTSDTDITEGHVYLITPYANYISDIADGYNDPHFETNMTAAEVLASLPTGFTATFSQKGGIYNIAADQLTDAQVATLVAVELKGTIAAGQNYNVAWNQTLVGAGDATRHVDTLTSYLSGSGAIDPSANAYVSVAEQTMPVEDNLETVSTSFGNANASADISQTSDGVTDNFISTSTYFDIDKDDVNSVTADFKISNDTDNWIKTNTAFLLPAFYTSNGSAPTYFKLDPTKITESTFTSALPSDATILYSAVPGEYVSMASLLSLHPNFSWDQLIAVQVFATLPAHSSYQINLPMIYTGPNQPDLSPAVSNSSIGIYAYNGAGNWVGDIQSDISLVKTYDAQLDGPYFGVYVNEDGSYTLAGADLQALLPQINKSDILIANDGGDFYYDVNASNTPLYWGGDMAIQLANIQSILVKNGYTVELNPDGSAMQLYIYNSASGFAPVYDSTDGTVKAVENGTNADGLVSVIKVLNTHDSTIQATKDTTVKLTDNFDGVGSSKYYTVGDSDVKATLDDPTGVLKDNGDGTYSVQKAGQYTVTYSLAISNSVTVTKKATVTVEPTILYGTATTTRTISYVNGDGTTNGNGPVVQTVTYKTTTNSLTGETVYTPQNGYYEVKSPAIKGYKPDQTVVSQQGLAATNVAPTDSEVVVTYNPTYSYGTATSTRTINFVNSDGTASVAPIVQTVTYKTVTNDATGETIYTPQGAYYEVKVPTQKGYVADKTVIAQEAVSATNALPTDTTVTVNYTPTYSYGTATSTRTINFVNADGTTNKTAPVVQTITYKTVTNDATGETVYTPQGAYYEYQVPTLTGYTASQTTVAQATVGATTTAPENTTVTITYTKIATKPDEGGTTKPDDGGTTTPDNGGTTTPDNGGTSTGTDGATVTPGWDDPGIVPPEGSFNPGSVDAGATNGGNGEETMHTTTQPAQAVKELSSTESTTEQPAAKQNLAAKRLPQTSETTAQTGSVIGLSLLGLLSVLGLAKKPRRED